MPQQWSVRLMSARCKEFPPIARLLNTKSLSAANFVIMQPPVQPEKKAEAEKVAADKATEEEIKTDSNMSPAEKKQLAERLSAEALATRQAEIQTLLQRNAAECYRTRVHIFPDVDSCKSFMESCAGQFSAGLTARTLLVDFTMLSSL